MERLYLMAARSTEPSTMRSAISWAYRVRMGTALYLANAASGWFPHSTAESVHVTQSKPPFFTAWTAPSRNMATLPYGSKSMTSNCFSGDRRVYITSIASP